MPGLLGNHAKSLDGVVRNTNESVWEMCDRLEYLARSNQTDDLKEREQLYGLKYIENGLLYCRELRHMLRPIDNIFRDWMHMIVNGGVGNTQCAHILHALEENDIPIAVPRTYLTECILPRKYGKVNAAWLGQSRVKEESLSSFASIMLSVVPILACFLLDCVKPNLEDDDPLHRHILCFVLLSEILGLLTMGADDAMAHMGELLSKILEHHSIFVDIYPWSSCKPKFHHCLHLVETFLRFKKVLSCFVLERKHRATKRAALHVFRHLEHTVLSSVINEQCEQIVNGFSLFVPVFLAHPRKIEIGTSTLLRSTEAVIHCGHIHVNDLVCLRGDIVARVVMFWQCDLLDSSIILQCNISRCLGQDIYCDSDKTHFASASQIVDAMIYRFRPHGQYRVILPFHAKYFRR